MASPVVCIRDTSITNGQLMVKDLWPNRSQANPVVDPVAQGPRYLRVVGTPTLPVLTGTVLAKTVTGLAAYLLVTIDRAAGTANISPAESVTMAEALISEMRTGADLTLNDIDTVLDGVVGGTGIVGTGDSTATVNNILQILAGAVFTVPAGYDLETAQNAPRWLSAGDQADSFDESVFQPIIEEDSSFWISVAQGDLLLMKSTRTVKGVNLDPYVVVYDGAGNAL